MSEPSTGDLSGAGGPELRQVIAEHRVIICAGPGGVGKTTTAASIALEAARQGRRACVVTIDPAKRLADALGLAELSNTARRVEGEWAAPGELWALMLDTKTTFDEVVARNATSPDQAQAILENRLYRNLSEALSGTQEYMAMEKLYELYQEERFDLIVVDTPPTRHALAFLEAPGRLNRFLNNRIFRLLMMPTRASLRAANVATRILLRTVSKVVGGDAVNDAVGFFSAFEGMEQGFRDRASRVTALLADSGTAFVVVAAPRRDAVDEALFFADRLAESAMPVRGLVVNRMFPRFAPTDVPGARAVTAPEGSGLATLVANLDDLDGIAQREERYIGILSGHLPGAPVVRVPLLPGDVHDVAGLTEVATHLFATR